MKVYNQDKTEIIEDPDLELGYLKSDTLKKHIEEQTEIKEQFHYVTIKEYANGGKDVEKVIDVKGRPYVPAHDEVEEIQVYVPYTNEQLLEREKDKLRIWREKYFGVIDRAAWFYSLTEEQKAEVVDFRKKLLDITDTLEKPEIPECVREQLNGD